MDNHSQNSILSPEQAVRDLQWVMDGPLLLDHPSSVQRASACDSIDAGQLFEFLQKRFVISVGRYFEWLVHYYLKYCLQVELLSHGKQIRVDKQTIGELDFLYRDNRGICHLETAVKFYLHLEDVHQSGSHFPGPNPADNFESKLNRLITHQLPLSKTYAPEVTHREPFVKGIIFYRPGCVRPKSLPNSMAADHSNGIWLRSNELSTIGEISQLAKTECRFHPRQKPFWLANDSLALGDDELQTAEQLQGNLNAHFKADRRPIMVSALQLTGNRFEEFERLMVVHESWPAE